MIHRANHSGFTLIETLVAIAILTIAIGGPFATAEHSIEAANIAQNKMTAAFLAQEGIEFVRAMRDNAYLSYCYSGVDAAACEYWWNGFTTNTYGGTYNILQCTTNGCALDTRVLSGELSFGSGSIAPCSAGNLTCGALYLTSDGQYTTQSTGNTSTSFVRKISATQVSDTEIAVSSTVTWSTHGKPYAVTVKDYFTSWY
ncbi:MAG TPA: prepilin-type N-terminal cleavage/methylation domain-containing protein [Candidatus Paceibacterota bacterium]